MGPGHWLMVGCLGSSHFINVLLLFEQERFFRSIVMDEEK
jgi:hypothetical protein